MQGIQGLEQPVQRGLVAKPPLEDRPRLLRLGLDVVTSIPPSRRCQSSLTVPWITIR